MAVMQRLLLIIILGLALSASTLAEETRDMVQIPGGTFWMGSDEGLITERPAHRVSVDTFRVDKYPVTNAQYARFVEATGFVTYSEKDPDPADYPGADPELLVAGSAVFAPPDGPVDMNNILNWWEYMPGANWNHPEGPDSSIEGREDHPVVHVTHQDAEAYCKWAGKQMLTEAQFEFAARGGFDRKKYSWGDQPRHFTEPLANTWQGEFPYENKNLDKFVATSPVGSFPPNGYGLYDVSGNVWEWVSDWYHPAYFANSPANNPVGVSERESLDPREPGIAKRLIKGGSYLCSDNYCAGYRPSARMPAEPYSSTGHIGFRCASRP